MNLSQKQNNFFEFFSAFFKFLTSQSTSQTKLLLILALNTLSLPLLVFCFHKNRLSYLLLCRLTSKTTNDTLSTSSDSLNILAKPCLMHSVSMQVADDLLASVYR